MAPSSRSARGRPIWWLGGIVLLLIAIYTAGWYYAASRLRETVLRAISPSGSSAVTGECRDMDLRGYPLKIGVFCSKLDLDDKRNGISASFGALRSGAKIYDPGAIAWELDGPAELRNTHGLSLNAEWTALTSSLRTRLKGIERSSTVIDGLKASGTSSATGQTLSLDAGRSELHLEQTGEDLVGALALSNAKAALSDFPQLLPGFNLKAQALVTGKAGLIDGSDDAGLYGASGELTDATADIGEGRTLSVAGPFSFDQDGFLSGKFTLRIDRLDPWRDALKQALPDAAKTVDTVAKLLKALAVGGQRVSVDVVVDHGEATVGGFIPLGRIPPI